MAICLDEPREAQCVAGFIALQLSKMWGMFEGGEERTMNAGLEGGRVPLPQDSRGTPTSPIKIRKVYSCHQQRRKFLNRRMSGQDPSDRLRSVKNIYSYDGVQMRGTLYILQAVDCSEDPRCHQGRNEAPGQGPSAPGG